MANDTTTRGYELPHPDNIAREDAGRVRRSIEKIDTALNDLDAKETPAATEEISGRVRLATAAEATAGTASDAVPTIQRTKDMVTAALTAAQAALKALQEHVAEELAAADDEIDQALDDLTASINTQLGNFATTLAAKFDKAGGTLTGDVAINKVAAASIYIRGQLAGKDRWVVQMGNGSAETGSNAGSNLSFLRYNDAGALIDTVFTINRATGMASFAKGLTNNGTLDSGVQGQNYKQTINGDLYVYGNGVSRAASDGLIWFGNGHSIWFGYNGGVLQSNAWITSPRGARHADTADLGGYATLGQMNNFVVHCRFVHAGDAVTSWTQTGYEVGSACITSVGATVSPDGNGTGLWTRFRYLQYYIPNIGYASFVWN